ncbi:TIM barrel protein [Calidifontibacter sp. DB0510]|uniref:TIM barrel protein n=1 Tax=Metallococcus carri TaxID=1656884 RepID=A0A967B5Z2_9MICO|nr:TIM barrel protein [Metallococcus carri]NHN56217.1 TIM barrel protein [Metallococcus carri]NOP38732.1 TIM barrel protein [Calidifontibacter sp. DB2511S]
MTALASRIAGAPISWGVCEVPDWGWQLAPGIVLDQMGELGLGATEFGPDGFLPKDPAEKVSLLSAYELRSVGQFVPAVLHRTDHDPLPAIADALDALVVAQANVLVLAAATGTAGYDGRPSLDEQGWELLLERLDLIRAAAAERGLTAALHPHVGTMIEREPEVRRALDDSRIDLCLDTGHLLIGGTDPVRIARETPERIAHVHLKDVRADLAAAVRAGDLSYADAVRAGLYVPLGSGQVDIAGIVTALEAEQYAGWYVLEQDTMLADGDTGVSAMRDVSASIAFLMGLGLA